MFNIWLLMRDGSPLLEKQALFLDLLTQI